MDIKDQQEYKLQLAKKIEIQKELNNRKEKEKYRDDFKSFAKDQLRIITKDATQGYVPFEFNEAQQLIHDKVEEQ